MDKILSKDTIKNVFSALGAKTSDSNYGVALLDKTSGEPKGFMGMSDLASVLGGVTELRTYNLYFISSKIEIEVTGSLTNHPWFTLLITIQKTNAGISNKAVYLMQGYGEMTDNRTMHTKLFGDYGITITYSSYKATITVPDSSNARASILQIGGDALTVTAS